MYLIITPDGYSFKACKAQEVYDFLYECEMEPGTLDGITNLTNDTFDFLIYGGYQISKEDGRLLREVEFIPF